MRWPSNRAPWECLRFLCLFLSDSAESQCFLFSLCFCGLVRPESLSLCWWELDEFVLTAGLAASQSLLFCLVCCVLAEIFGSTSTPFWLVLWLSVGTFGLEFLLHGEVFPSLNAGMFVDECLLPAPVSFWFAEECLCKWLPWFGDGLGLSGFLGALTSEPVPVWESKQNRFGEFFQTSDNLIIGQWNISLVKNKIKMDKEKEKICRPAKMALVSVPWAPSGSDRVKSS